MLDTLTKYYVSGYRIGFRMRIGWWAGLPCMGACSETTILQHVSDSLAMHWPMSGDEYNPGSGMRRE